MNSISGPKNNANFSTNSSEARQTLSTNKQYLNLIPPLSEMEFDSLKQSIREKGLLVPVIVNRQGIILDGHHRARACRELGIGIHFYTKEFKDS